MCSTYSLGESPILLGGYERILSGLVHAGTAVKSGTTHLQPFIYTQCPCIECFIKQMMNWKIHLKKQCFFSLLQSWLDGLLECTQFLAHH